MWVAMTTVPVEAVDSSHSEPIDKCSDPVEETPLEDCIESELRHLLVAVLPGPEDDQVKII